MVNLFFSAYQSQIKFYELKLNIKPSSSACYKIKRAYKLSYFSTTEKPYWRDKGSTPTALQTASNNSKTSQILNKL